MFRVDGGVEVPERDAPREQKLHRRDTPHHLKNKRINTHIDHEKVAAIIAQVCLSFIINCMLLTISNGGPWSFVSLNNVENGVVTGCYTPGQPCLTVTSE